MRSKSVTKLISRVVLYSGATFFRNCYTFLCFSSVPPGKWWHTIRQTRYSWTVFMELWGYVKYFQGTASKFLFWHISVCRSIKLCCYLWETFKLRFRIYHFEGPRQSGGIAVEWHVSFCSVLICCAKDMDLGNLKIVTLCFFKTLVSAYKPAWHYNPEA
jgi:hypothetical protein